MAQVTFKDILLAVIIPLALAELGPWCGWLAARLLPLAAKLRYGDTERAAVRLEEWSGDLDDIPGQLTKLAYAIGQLAAGSAVSARRKTVYRLPSDEAVAVYAVPIEGMRSDWRMKYAGEHPGVQPEDIPPPPGSVLFGNSYREAGLWDEYVKDMPEEEVVWLIATVRAVLTGVAPSPGPRTSATRRG